ncbi:MAG: cobalamin biosynthesis protein P47K [Fuerstiella sp.]|nr:cobalamin biosynthesis protein P47K [Fuerstiella sp.]
MHKIQYIMVGGFLGAGKTTTLARLAEYYTSQGLNVGIVTNDQASDLVDTNMLRALGFDVGEVAGACFCCSFDDLMSTVRGLGREQRPDIILAEPVGSCTDLVATVIQPIRQLFDAEFRIAPYAVILKPSHGKRILRKQQQAGFSPKAAYIFTKQLEEADLVLINRVDELTESEAGELENLVRTHVDDRPVLRMSARTGTGFEEFIELLAQEGDYGRRLLDIDYDTYAEGEAELGWLNSSLRVRSNNDFELDALLLQIVEQLKLNLQTESAEPAHLKAIGLWEGFFGVANLVSSDSPVELSLPSSCSVASADVIINARVACDPKQLESIVMAVVGNVLASVGATAEFRGTRSFRPGRPEPTHRITEISG